MHQMREWSGVIEYLHDSLGRSAKEAGNMQAALHHYAAVLPGRSAAPQGQAQYLRQFLDLIQQAAALEVLLV